MNKSDILSLVFHRLFNYTLIMKSIDITSIIKKYGPGYIAKNKKTGKVVAHAKRIDILFNKTKNISNIVISWVPKKNARYVF